LGPLSVHLLESPDFFCRPELYGDEEGDYADNHLRFAFFCRAVLLFLQRGGIRPDIIHCHDWQTALIPYLLRYQLQNDPFFQGSATVFTIHNLAYQGLFPATVLPDLGLVAEDDFTMARLEYYDRINLLKGGLIGADALTTVSRTYAAEILETGAGCGLEGVLAQRRDALQGIVNGIDTREWDPATDGVLRYPFSSSSPSGKALQKRLLQEEAGLEAEAGRPLVAMVTRLSNQKGIELVMESLPWMVAHGLQVVILGSGEPIYRDALKEWAAEVPGHLAFFDQYDPARSRRIFAGSDIFLMPSRYEPCGIGQLMALRYGAVPLVRRTGGLADTVVDMVDDPVAYTGFLFDEFSAKALQQGLARALAAYGRIDSWQRLVKRGMEADFSWGWSAQRYEEVFRWALEKKGR
jgi:starch synthase